MNLTVAAMGDVFYLFLSGPFSQTKLDPFSPLRTSIFTSTGRNSYGGNKDYKKTAHRDGVAHHTALLIQSNPELQTLRQGPVQRPPSSHLVQS